MKKRQLLYAAVLIAGVLFSRLSYAQAVYGSIYGTVTDSTGAAIPNATVTVTDEAKGNVVTVQSNATGAYTVEKLIPDRYDVRVAATGFKSVDSPHNLVYADTAPKLDFTMQVGATSQTVQVTSAAPLLTTDRADVALILNQKYMSNLPVANRNFTSLTLLLPGAQSEGQAPTIDEDPSGSEHNAINGQDFGMTGYELDGTDNEEALLGQIVINPLLEDVTEAKITTSNYDAEFGDAASAVITVQTKSGTNSIHGSAFDYRESNANLARNPFTQLTQSAVPAGLQNQFGGSIGGPIKKDKIFYFGGYQGFRERNGLSYLTTVPTALAKSTCTSGGNCNLSDYLTLGQAGVIYDPQTQGTKAFAGNIIPGNRLSPVAVNLLKNIPDPNIPGALYNNYQITGSGLFNTNQFDVRMDDVTSEKLHTFGRYSQFMDTVSGGAIFGPLGGAGFGNSGFAGSATGLSASVALGGDYVFGPNLLADLRLGYYRYHVDTNKYDGTQPFATDNGLPGLNLGTANTGGAPAFYIGGTSGGPATAGLADFGTSLSISRCNCPLQETEQQFQIVSNWTRITGNHSLKFGADLRYALNYRVPSDINQAGEFTFAASNTQNTRGLGGIGLATFLLGNVSNFSREALADTAAKNFQKRTFFYVQDTWKATSKLVVNYGLRWEIYFPETANGKGQGSLLNLDTGNLQVAGYGPYGTNMGAITTFKLLAPRVGISYQPNAKMVIRAGYGRSYGVGFYGALFGDVTPQNLPVLDNQNLTQERGVFSPVFTLGTPPPLPFFGNLDPTTGVIPLPNGVIARTRPLSERVPTIDAWNLSIQQQLTHTLAMTLAYVGNKGTHTFAGTTENVNPNELALTANGLSYNPPSKTDPAVGENPNLPVSPASDVRRHPYYPKYGWTQAIDYRADAANTNYNALQATVEQTFAHGLQFTANYAWQRAMNYHEDYFEIKKFYGRYDFLRDQTLKTFGTWQLPIGRGGLIGKDVSVPVNYLIGGWELEDILEWSSGLPYWPSYQDCAQERDTGPCTPNLLQGQSLPTHLTGYSATTHQRTFFTPVPTMTNEGSVSGPFQRPLLDQFGNLQRNSFTGPSYFNADMAVQKYFRVKDRVTAIFRVDAFNVFNHIAPGNPKVCIDCSISSGAGAITSMANTPRQLQFALRVLY